MIMGSDSALFPALVIWNTVSHSDRYSTKAAEELKKIQRRATKKVRILRLNSMENG